MRLRRLACQGGRVGRGISFLLEFLEGNPVIRFLVLLKKFIEFVSVVFNSLRPLEAGG